MCRAGLPHLHQSHFGRASYIRSTSLPPPIGRLPKVCRPLQISYRLEQRVAHEHGDVRAGETPHLLGELVERRFPQRVLGVAQVDAQERAEGGRVGKRHVDAPLETASHRRIE